MKKSELHEIKNKTLHGRAAKEREQHTSSTGWTKGKSDKSDKRQLVSHIAKVFLLKHSPDATGLC